MKQMRLIVGIAFSIAGGFGILFGHDTSGAIFVVGGAIIHSIEAIGENQ